MSFQFILDYAESVSLNSQPMVASTMTRDGVVRTVERGGQPWRIEIKMPDGQRWTDMRDMIATAEGLDRHTKGTLQFNTPNTEWLMGYTGDLTNTAAFNGAWDKGNTAFSLAGGTGITSTTKRVRAGDIVQLGGTSGYIYKVVKDVVGIANATTVHRPIINGGSGPVLVGQNCVFNVYCTQFPQWTIFARNQVSWSGSFVFTEVIT